MTATALRFGASSKLYRDTAAPLSWTLPTWLEITNAHDKVDVGLSFSEQDATIRGVGPIKLTEPTLLEVEIGWTMLEDITDANFLALRLAFFTKAVVHLLNCSGVYTVAGETYVELDAKICKFAKGEPLDGINTYDVSAKPCYSLNMVQTGITPVTAGAANGLG
jgi:hypothetical protein